MYTVVLLSLTDVLGISINYKYLTLGVDAGTEELVQNCKFPSVLGFGTEDMAVDPFKYKLLL